MLILLASVFSCRKSPQELYIDAIKDYKKTQSQKSKDFIINSMFEKCSFYITESLKKSSIKGFDSCYYDKKQNNFIMLNGNTYSPENSTDITFAAYNPALNAFAYSDGYKAFIIDLSTNSIAKEIDITSDNKISIDGFTISGNKIVYFYKRKLYTIDLNNYQTGKLFPKSTFSPPFSKNSFRINIITHGNYTALTVGHAGKYNLSIINGTTGNILLKDKKVSSYSMKFLDTKLFYVAGSSGKWIFANYNISNKVTDSLITFKKLKDLRFSGSYAFIMEDKNYVIIHIPTEDKISIPKEFSLIDIYEESIIIDYNGKYFFCETEKFFQEMEDVRIKIPNFLK